MSALRQRQQQALVPPARLFAIERWAERNPRVRWPLVLLAILLLVGLAGGLELAP